MNARVQPDTSPQEPLVLLDRWLEDACRAGVPAPRSVAFVTVGERGQPTARTVSLKRLEDGALLFTSALWTRKARELEQNPNVALLFHWPSLGRQVHVAGQAVLAERAVAEELFSERDPAHQMQTIVSRQGEPIEDLAPLRARTEQVFSDGPGPEEHVEMLLVQRRLAGHCPRIHWRTAAGS